MWEMIGVGDKVSYVRPNRIPERGRVKRMDEEGYAWVVFCCNQDWDNYMNYTGQLTRLEDLRMGWDHE